VILSINMDKRLIMNKSLNLHLPVSGVFVMLNQNMMLFHWKKEQDDRFKTY
jgi:hypothetical protein